MKSKHDSRHVFSSIPLFHRALHTISTRRYRYPVRRYIIELFDIKLDGAVIDELAQQSRIAKEEMKNGNISLMQRHGSRRTRPPTRPRPRRKSSADVTRPTEEQQPTEANENSSIVRAKTNIVRIPGFKS